MLTIDTDGLDMVAAFIGTPFGELVCLLCDGEDLPGADALANTSVWTVGESSGSMQWIRTHPLAGDGFRGVIGTGFVDADGTVQPWPADITPFRNFPELGLVQYAKGLSGNDFPLLFDDGAGGNWQAVLATNDGQSYLTNVTVVPEPQFVAAATLASLLCLCKRRRS